jgi:hypothetical protein
LKSIQQNGKISISRPKEETESPMDWAIYQPRVRFDARAERDECERLYRHQARVLQDRLARRGHTDRTRQHAIPEWEKIYQAETHAHLLLHQARVLGWGREKRYYYAHKQAA